jgi:membrane protein implicated in regulation of membrane protease activity
MTTLTRYYLFQIPGWVFAAIILAVLWSSLGLPAWLASGLFGLLVIKDVVFYPLLRTAYEVGTSGAAQLVGQRGVARDRLDPAGYIHVRGELWRARIEQGAEPIQSGAAVKVIAGNRMTLTVVASE